jgi:hypothetical protein
MNRYEVLFFLFVIITHFLTVLSKYISCLVYLYCVMTAESGIADTGKTSTHRQLPVNTSAVPGPSLAAVPNSSRGSGVFCAVSADVITRPPAVSTVS